VGVAMEKEYVCVGGRAAKRVDKSCSHPMELSGVEDKSNWDGFSQLNWHICFLGEYFIQVHCTMLQSCRCSKTFGKVQLHPKSLTTFFLVTGIGEFQ
jgi:hypothetical protein